MQDDFGLQPMRVPYKTPYITSKWRHNPLVLSSVRHVNMMSLLDNEGKELSKGFR